MLHRRFIPLWLGIALALCGLAGLAPAAQAAPAAPVDIPMTQPDGTPFTARQWGDEWLHGYETVDGYTILQAEDGAWVYAARGADGALVPVLQDGQRLLVGQAAPPSQSSGARPDLPASAPVRETFPSSPLLGQNSGTQRLLMVMVNFQDRTRIYNPVTTFLPKFFGASSSIRDFYLDASFNALTLEPAVETFATVGAANDGLIEVTLAMNHPSDTNQSQTIAAAAYNAVNPYINFASYDSDGDGYVSGKELHFVMIIAGYEESYGGYVYPCIWGHQYNLASPLLLDGVYVGTSSADGDYGGYAMFGEIHGDHPATIGIMVHEMGHNLTWPDLYDTDGGSEGVGRWSIMGSASWNYVTYPGDTPGLPDAFLKWYQGWITPTTALNGQTYSLDRTDITPEALILGANPNGIDWEFTRYSGLGEYWLVENRQLNGYDAALPGCGVLIWHIDETRTYTNLANATEERPLVALEQADGLLDLQNQSDRGDTGDPYPGSTGNRWFNDTTNPNSRYYSGASSNHSVTVNSTSCAAAMSVSYTGVSAPPGAFNKTSPANGATGQSTSPTLVWTASTGAASYEYCYDTSNDNNCTTWTSNGAATSKLITGLAYSTTYYWHVRAVNTDGVTYSNGSSTAFWSFTTGAQPPQTKKAYLPLIWKTQPYTRTLTYRGEPVAGKVIQMIYTTDDWDTWSIYATATTNAAGYYAFPFLPDLGTGTDGKEAGIQWPNPDSSYSLPQLAGWVCWDITGSVDDLYTCNFDTQDVVLGSPAHDASVTLPYTFTWTRRTTTSDLYEVDWWDPDLGHYMWTNLLPYASSFKLYSIPDFFHLYYPYNWTVYVYGSNGYGVPYWYRWVRFVEYSSPPLEGVSATHDLLSANGGDLRSLRFGPRPPLSQPRPAVPGLKPR